HCSGVLEVGLGRGWPETGASRLRRGVVIAFTVNVPGVSLTGPAVGRGWPETGASRLRRGVVIAFTVNVPGVSLTGPAVGRGWPETGTSRLRGARFFAAWSTSPAWRLRAWRQCTVNP